MKIEKFDLLLDYRSAQIQHERISEELRRIVKEQRIFDIAGRTTLVLPEAVGLPPELESDRLVVLHDAGLAMGSALQNAEWSGCALAVIKQAGWNNFSISALMEHVDADPMVGVVQGRFISPAADRVYSLPWGSSFTIPCAAVNYLPEYYLAVEFDSSFVVITRQGVRNAPRVESLPQPFDYADVYRGLRRRGFRNLVCNRILVPTENPPEATYPSRAAVEHGERDAAADRPQQWLADMPERQLEIILAGAFTPAGKPRLLIDCRGMPPYFNGTAASVLGFLQGFEALSENPFAIVVLASEEAARFHRLAETFTDFEITTGRPQGAYFAAVLMNQPWSVDTLRDYSRIAWLSLYNMLDTIAWDIGFAAPAKLDRVWSLLGQTADAILFNSAYSRDRYAFRFHPDGRIPLVVTHHSTAPAEIAGHGASASGDPADPFLFVVGNEYDHKAMDQTLETLAEAFPYARIIALGAGASRHANVEAAASGGLSAEQVAELYRTAKAVVFPSHYEGFGLPVVEALAWGKPVLVRSSPLWDEIAGLSSRAGLIVRFGSEGELLEKVAGLLSSPPPTPFADSGGETSWAQCAGRIVEAVARLALSADRNGWTRRHAVLAP